MSDRLAISATFSVLTMAAYVLFGTGASRVDLGPESFRTPISLSAPAQVGAPGTALVSFN